MKYLLNLGLICLSLASSAQAINASLYDTDRLSPTFHEGRRAAFRAKMPANSVAIFFANPERQRNNDTDFQYAQNPNLYYVTGYTEPNALLIITKEEVELNGITSHEFFFAQDRNPSMEVWTGRRLGKEGVEQQLKLATVFTGKDFKNFSLDFGKFDKVLGEYPSGVAENPYESASLSNLIVQCKNKLKDKELDGRSFLKIMADLRAIKQPEELVLLQKAIDISCLGHLEVMKYIEPNAYEFQAQSVMEYVFKNNGSEYIGYPSICGGAENACILHYITNRRKLQANDIYLTDCAAEYHGYTADITRTMPVGGKFSPAQKQIYELVLAAQEAGFKACQPGKHFYGVHQAAYDVIAKGLVELGITKSTAEAFRYFNHGTSHFLGLDVHDMGDTRSNLQAGHLLTVEPGIYIPANSPCDTKWWNIGVRIEDDVLITTDGHKVLSLAAPRSVADIEKIMAERSALNK
ncbi:MAG: aminopeptidase P N-terminal domain-containing protein [Spirosomataceae bacterium]